MSEDTKDLINLDDEMPPAGDFEIKCLRCGSTNCEVVDARSMGSSATGIYGTCYLHCKQCEAEKDLQFD